MNRIHMRRTAVSAVVLLCLPMLVAGIAVAATPGVMSLQGVLAGPDGTAVADGDYAMTFTLWDAPDGGSALWAETLSVPILRGVYDVTLGESNPLSATLFDGERFLGVAVDPDPEMTPRRPVTSTAFAFRAEEADVLSGHPPADFVQKGESAAVTAAMIAAGAVGGPQISFGAVGTQQIADGSISDADLAEGLVLSRMLSADGAGSTLDADYLDGMDSTAFFILSQSPVITGVPAFIGGDAGTPPFTVDGTAKVQHLNADYLDGLSASAFFNLAQSPTVLGVPAFTGGDSVNPPFTVDSAARVPMLNADFLDGLSSDDFMKTGADFGRSGVAEDLYEGTLTLTQRYVSRAGDALSGASADPVGAFLSIANTESGATGNGISAETAAVSGIGGRFVATGDQGVGLYADGGDNGWAAQFKGNVRIIDAASDDVVLELGKGLDVAEGFDVSGRGETPVPPGSVLVIDPDHPGRLAVSAVAYDTKVAGIAAGAHGLGSGVRLGAGSFDVDVALAGRVYCFVDAGEQGVQPGDLLTTSETPGHAMKASDPNPSRGAILGKAMEYLEKGKKGRILVLVTLQ